MLTASPRRPPLGLASLRSSLSRWGILDWLRLLWCAVISWYEFASFLWSLSSCSWPDKALFPAPGRERPAHLLLVADPQVRDLPTSRAAGFDAIRQHLVDFTLKRNWFFASRRSPDIVVFLGDILASWRFIRSDDEYERNYNKFLEIFRLDRRIPIYFVPGNNDVGLNIEPAVARQARRRFTTHFGALNQKISVYNHTLIMLDAAGLVEEDYQRAAKSIDYDHWTPLPRGPVEFVHSLRDEAEEMNPTILFTHIPLHRPDTASCGPLRERGTIRRGVGPSYQNMLGKKTTTFLLQSITPQVVFSADDKDFCDYVHIPPPDMGLDANHGSPENRTAHAKPQKAREVTLKAFAPSSEIRYPGFQLLSLTYPSSPDLPSLATTPCFLPDYSTVYTWRYLPLLLLTILTLTLLRRRKLRSHSLPTHLDTSALRHSFSLTTLPSTPWSAPHPPTPYSPDWSPHTPGFQRSGSRASMSPQEEFAKDTLRAPLVHSHSHPSLSTLSPTNRPATPTFRATAIPHIDDDGHAHRLPTGPAHLDADELDEDEYGYYHGQRQPLRVKLDRADSYGGGDVTPSSDASAVDELAFTFTLYGRRRRIAFWVPLSGFTGKLRGGGGGRTTFGAGGGARGRSRRGSGWTSGTSSGRLRCCGPCWRGR
ncbi:hypothetical protein C8Q80DRAFT_861563 [Daedaleopsis nitida]|nr:hypothetical protein C8Q80DRAFT_861563 [Daedaleopsis nitida]